MKFLPQFVAEIRGLVAQLLEASPIQRLTFSSDYQFEPQLKRYSKSLGFEAFCKRHDAEELRLNARYFIRL